MFGQKKKQTIITHKLKLSKLLIRNDSYKHNVPPNSESHFNVQIVSDDFLNLSQIQRHKIVYKAVGTLLAEIHAFSITAMTTLEFKENPSFRDTPDCEN